MVASFQGSTGILMRQRGFVNFCSRAKSKVQYLIFFVNALPIIAKISSGSQIEHRKVTSALSTARRSSSSSRVLLEYRGV